MSAEGKLYPINLHRGRASLGQPTAKHTRRREKMKRRTEITVETDRIMVIRRRPEKNVTGWCAACNGESFMFTVDEAAMLLGVTSMTVFRWAEAGRLHWLETAAGQLLICQSSLLQNRRGLLNAHDASQTETA